MKKITVLVPDLATGGAQKVMLSLANGFAERQYKVEMLVLFNKGELFTAVPSNIQLVTLANYYKLLFPVTLVLVVFKLAHHLKKSNPDIVFSTLTGTNLIVLIAKRLFCIRAPIVIRETSTARNTSRTVTRWLIRKIYPIAQRVIAVTREIAKEMSELYNIDTKNITVIHNPINTQYIQKRAGEITNHPWFDDKEYSLIVAVGRLVPAKGYPVMIEAIKELTIREKVRLIIVGEGPERENIIDIINKLGLTDNISLVGYQENPYVYIQKADLLVVSSLWEGFVNVLLEALSLGIPVVSSNCPSGPSEILENGRYGQLVPMGDSKALSIAISKAIHSPVNKDQLINRASEFSVDTIIRDYLNVFKKITKQYSSKI